MGKKRLLLAVVFLVGLTGHKQIIAQVEQGQKTEKACQWKFPQVPHQLASYPRPFEGEVLDISPPGFCWWRVHNEKDGKAKPEDARYRLVIIGGSGERCYKSPLLDDPVHVPDRVLPEGKYSWFVEAVGPTGKVLDKWPVRSFTIAPNATAQPWIPAAELLARVPKEHPRLIFLKADLPVIRKTLKTTRKEAFASLKKVADENLSLTPPGEPTYDQLENPVDRTIGYYRAFQKLRRHHQDGMRPLALMYLLTGEKKYGEAAKAILLDAADWDPEGISSVMGGKDEVGIGLALAGPQTYDWLYELLSEEERNKVKKMLIARAEHLLHRLRNHTDYLYRSGSSHEIELIVFLAEFAIVLAEEPQAKVWLDYSLRALLTAFPHFDGRDGGWNEGIPYGLAYNLIFMAPMQSITAACGFDMWQRPYFKKARKFFMYCVSIFGEVVPFGDGEQGGSRLALVLSSMFRFYGNLYQDPTAAWWADSIRDEQGKRSLPLWLNGLILPNTIEPKTPVNLCNDAAFFGVGWAALHSDICNPKKDLMILFKSSPFGSISHSYADQNTFAIMKGSAVLAAPGGGYYPVYGAPFHADYTRRTKSKNGILINGEGQIVRKASANGHLIDFQSTKHLGYVCGDAVNAYEGLFKRFRRHVLMIRPSLICVIDDLEGAQGSQYQWLLHSREKMEIDEKTQTIVSRRKGETMSVTLISPDGFAFDQTDAWPIDPKEGYPNAHKEPPAKQWHFTATTRERSGARRIAAIMYIPERNSQTEAPNIKRLDDDILQISTRFKDDEARIWIDLSVDQVDSKPIIKFSYQPKTGTLESLAIK